jgi:cellulose synthase/poly-beta-1,6-N-acetylglucosamine synthase-like glycosyltransferase
MQWITARIHILLWGKHTVLKVTGYIPVYNGAQFVGPNIEGMLSQTHPMDEILVIDDASSDATGEIAAKYPSVTVIRHPVNKGVAGGRNTALRAARNELVAAFDADCVASPTWLASLLPHLEDPKVAGAGGRLVEGVQRTMADRWRQARMAQEWGPNFIRNPQFLYGCNTLFRKSVILEAGGYDESMRTCGEDPDICARLRKRGFDLVYEPAALATHFRRDTTRSVLDMYWRWWKFGNQAYRNGVRLRSVLGNALFVHFRYNFLLPAKTDLRAARLDLLAMDFLALGYMPFRDFRLLMSAKSSSK